MESSGARRARPPRQRPLLYGALAALLVVGSTAAGTVLKTRAQSMEAVSSSAASVAPSASGPAAGSVREEASVDSAAQSAVDHDERLTTAMKAVDVPDGAEVSVAVLDMESGQSASYGDGSFDTASIVKVDILAALLLQAQDEGRQLTTTEKSDATAMIENSDNASASRLWRTIGKAAGLDAANKRFGLTGTEGGDGMLWGLTQTTATDQLRLLQQVFGADSELDEDARAYLRGLMGQIAEGQQWGVSAAADGSGWALKNGWLPRTATGLWDVNSIGRVTVDGHDYLVAALSDGNATQAKGISLVESAAVAAVSVFSGKDTTGAASASVFATASS